MRGIAACLAAVLLGGGAASADAVARPQTDASPLPIGAPIEHPRGDRTIERLPLPEREAAYRQRLAGAVRDHGDESIEVAAALGDLARTLEAGDRFTEAELLYRREQAIVFAFYAARRAAGRFREIVEDSERRGVDPFGESLAFNLQRQGRGREAGLIWAEVRSQRHAAGESGWEPPEIAGRGSLPGVLGYRLSHVPASVRAPTDEERSRIYAMSVALQGASDYDPRPHDVIYADLLALQSGTLGPDHPETIDTHRTYAADLLNRGRAAEAETIARRALALQLRANPAAAAETVYLLAQILRSQERWSEAQPFLDRALAAAVNAEVVLASADNRLRLGDDGGAERDYRQAANLFDREYGPHHPDTLSIRTMVAFLLGRQGRYVEAAEAYRATCRGRVERARAFSRGELASAGQSSRAADAADCSRRLANALRRIALSGEGGRDEALRTEAFDAAQVFQQSAAGESLARSGARVAAASAGAGDVAERYELRLAERTALERLLRELDEAEDHGSVRRAQLAAERDRLDAQIAALAVDLARRHPLYWDLRSPEPVGIGPLQRELLRDDEALILFVIPPGEIRGLVFAVSRTASAWADIPLSGDEVEARVRALRSQIDPYAYGLAPPGAGASPAEPGAGAFDRGAAHDLYRALLGDPAIAGVIAAPHTLLFVPSGPMTSLPPGILVTAPPGGGAARDGDQEALRETPWLLRDKAVAVLPSVASLRTLRQLLPERQRPTEPLLAFANPDFGGGIQAFLGIRSLSAYFREGVPIADALRTLPPLPGTLDEGLALARALRAPAASVLTGRDASEAALMTRNADRSLARVRVLEFATHGLVAGELSGLAEPALVLAAADDAEDSLLTASEVAGLRLNAEWVLLSACNTASPDSTEAQGLSGLARAFFYAGARTLLVSHWRVNDGIAPVLVPAILAASARDPRMSRAEALRRASLAILDDRTIPAAHPSIWAPFTLVGEAAR